jgi:uncharacterized RDD family membrane protein YckC
MITAMSGPPPPAPPTGSRTVPRPGEVADRFLARLIDGLLLLVVICVLSGIFATTLAPRTDTGVPAGLTAASAVATFVSGVIIVGYFVVLESRRGQTVGKQIMKLRVVGPGGANPTAAESFRRNIWLAAFLLEFLPVIGGIAYWVVSLTAAVLIAVGISNDKVNRQGWHDRFAGGTQVLKIG